MNEAPPNFQPNWPEIIVSASTEGADANSIFEEAFQMLHSINEENKLSWLKTSIDSFNEISDENIIRKFFLIYISEIQQYLEEDLSRLDFFIEAIENCIESPHRILFLNIYAEIFPSFFPDCNSIDLNFLLAIQSPIFSYCVNRHPDSDEACQLWFHSLASSQGSEIFKDNYELALSYFKIMNHAFFQISVTTTQAAQQEESFVNAQKAMKSAIVAITTSIDQ